MQIGKYTIGKYLAVLKSIFEDGSVSYETEFDDSDDLWESVCAYKELIGEKVYAGKNEYKVMTDFVVVFGVERIVKELGE